MNTVQFVQISVGAKIYYAEGIDKLLKNMSECKPEIMTAVPRFYQNLYQKINSNFKKQTGFKKKIINATISLGSKKLNKDKIALEAHYKSKGFLEINIYTEYHTNNEKYMSPPKIYKTNVKFKIT